MVAVFAAILLKDCNLVGSHFESVVEYLQDQSLLYVPLSKGGEPKSIVHARVLQATLRDLMASLPMLGLITETHEFGDRPLHFQWSGTTRSRRGRSYAGGWVMQGTPFLLGRG